MFLLNQIFGKDKTSVQPPSTPHLSMMEQVVTDLYEVPGMTNDQLRLYPDKAAIYIRFKDGSGTLRRFVNFAKVHHVYVFDKKNVCQFAGYVGWIHNPNLEDELRRIQRDFGVI